MAAPVSERERIVAMDVLRGFVLLGILVMNIQSFSMPFAAYMNPTAYGDLTGANYWVWVAGHVFFDQKFMTIFSMLFGAGILLMTGRAGEDAAALHRRRMGWLVLFGLIHAYVFWYGDILYTYGLCGLIAFLFRDRRPALLIAIAAALIFVGSLLPVATAASMTPAQMHEMRDSTWHPTQDVLAREIAAYRGGLAAQSTHRVPESLAFQTFFFLFFALWKVLGLMLLGMALFKLDVFTARRPTGVYLALAAGGLGLGLPMVIFGMRQNFAHGWSVEYSMFLGGLWNYWGSVPVSIGYAGLFMAIVRSGAFRSLTSRLAAVGRLALSNYIFQTVAATTIFYGTGLGLFGSVERTGQIAIVVAIWAVQLLGSPIWLRFFQFGPLEWVWRSLTYGAAQPMRRATRTSLASS